MDIASTITYDQTFPVALLHPGTGEEVGITVNIVSFDSQRVVKAVKAVEADRWSAMFASENKTKRLTSEQVVEFSDKTERAQLISCIDSWDFNGNSFGDLGVDPVCDDKAREYLICHPNAKWIKDQIAGRAADLGNFSQPQEKSLRKKSAAK